MRGGSTGCVGGGGTEGPQGGAGGGHQVRAQGTHPEGEGSAVGGGRQVASSSDNLYPHLPHSRLTLL